MESFDQNPRRYYMGHNVVRLIIGMANNYKRLLAEDLYTVELKQEFIPLPELSCWQKFLIKCKIKAPRAKPYRNIEVPVQRNKLKQVAASDNVDKVMEALMNTKVGNDCRVFDFKAAPNQKVHVHVLDGKVLSEDDVLEATVIAATVCLDDKGELVYKYMTDMTDVAQLDAGDFSCCKPVIKEEDDETESC